MSIKENPNTLLEKADRASNLIEQMFLAHKISDENQFDSAHKEAGKLLFEMITELDKRFT